MQKNRWFDMRGTHPLAWIGHASFLALLVFSVIFFKERVCYADSAQQLLEMVNGNGFKVFVGRYSMLVNQLLPWALLKSGASLPAIMMGYSVSFILVYYACFLVCMHVLRNPAAALVVIAVPLMARLMFAHAISETWLAMGYSAVFYAWINYRSGVRNDVLRNALFYGVAVLLILLNYFLHPLTLFTTGFAVLFTMADRRSYGKPALWIMLGLLLAVYGYKFLFPVSGHEEGFFSGLRQWKTILPDLFSYPASQFFFRNFFRIYIYPAAFFIAALTGLALQRQWMKLLVSAGAVLFFYLVLVMAFHKEEGGFTMETRYMPFIFFFMIPAGSVLLTGQRKIAATSGILFVFLCISFAGIHRNVKRVHSRRIAYMKQIMETLRPYPENKYLLEAKNVDEGYLTSWALGPESLLLSSMKGPEHSQTFYLCADRSEISGDVFVKREIFMLVNWWIYFDGNKMNRNYFDVTKTVYRYIDYKIPYRK